MVANISFDPQNPPPLDPGGGGSKGQHSTILGIKNSECGHVAYQIKVRGID